jgi:hypothetical protein
MPRIARSSLMSLEAYARIRSEFRAKVMAHKKDRKVHLGEHITLQFEDELDAYNPLVPDGSNWKATMMIEYPDVDQRQHALGELIGVEDRVWVQVAGSARVFAIADEDLERENESKTSSVHFLRFELTDGMKRALRAGGDLAMGVDHPRCHVTVAAVAPQVRDSLLKDLTF